MRDRGLRRGGTEGHGDGGVGAEELGLEGDLGRGDGFGGGGDGVGQGGDGDVDGFGVRVGRGYELGCEDRGGLVFLARWRGMGAGGVGGLAFTRSPHLERISESWVVQGF